MIHGILRFSLRSLAGPLAALALLAAPSAARAADPAKPLNIVLLLTDDQRWDALSCMGNTILKTPNIDALAARGALFENNFCATSICCVSRASIFTGQYARRHGINDFDASLTEEAFAQTYPALLRKAGYRVGFIGKWGVGSNLHQDKFDYYDGFPGQGTYHHAQDGKPVHLTRLQEASALKFLDGCDPSRPFCLSISFKAPHVEDGAADDPFPYDPEFEPLYKDILIPHPAGAYPSYHDALPPFIAQSEGRARWQREFGSEELFQRSAKAYYRLIAGVDAAVGRIVEKLRQMGALESTAIIFTSDNGFLLGDKGLEGKWLMWEPSIRTPLIVVDPRLRPDRARRAPEMTLNIDLAPTILAFAGLTPPDSMDGRSVLPLLSAPGDDPHWRESWYYDHLFGYGGKIPKTEGVRTRDWKYTRYLDREPPYEELFDLKADPLEISNLAAAPAAAAKLAELRLECDRLRESIRP